MLSPNYNILIKTNKYKYNITFSGIKVKCN
jgi:hypothetical protein